MKKISLLLLCSVILFAFGCKKDKEEKTATTITENVMESVVNKATVVDSIQTKKTGPIEFGHQFFFSRDGKITALGCRLPTKNIPYTVNLWDFDNKVLLASATVTPTDSISFSYSAITPVAVSANTKYLVSLNNFSNGEIQSFFLGTKKGGAESLYPFTEGSVTFEGVYYIKSDTPQFPVTLNPSQAIIAGISDFIFEYTE
jgi:hypothetical protein